MAEADRATVETEQKALAEGVTEVELWLRKIELAKREEKDWHEDAEEAIKVYESDKDNAISFNILHSNVETLIPSLYNSTPVPDVRRRFGDADPIGKHVADVTERLISYSLDQYDVDPEFIAAVRDSLVTGRGVLRVRYTPHMQGEDQVGYQETTCERVPWDRYIRGPANSHAKLPWQAFEHDLTREELERLNPKIAPEIKLENSKEHDDDSKADKGVFRTAKVYEIWDKSRRQCLFIAECYKKKPLLKIDDPLRLPDFFPAMRPIEAMRRPSGLVPMCPYKVFKPLIDELDLVTKRIAKLVNQLKVRGLHDSEMTADFERIKDCDDGQFEGCDNVAKFTGQGGLDKAIWVWPMEPTVQALQQLYVQRDQIKQTIYEVTGISDIVRGASNAQETATAQQIKQQWGSLRVQHLQNEISRCARDLFRAKVAIMSAHYTPENISMMTGLPNKPELQQVWPQVLQVFKSPQMRSYKIDIETDSTIRADMTRNQEQMNSFLQGVGQFAQSAAAAAAQFGPAVQPVLVEMLTAFARKFKLGKQAEDALDSLSVKAQQQAQQPQQPNPEQQKAEMEMQALQAKAQMDQQTAQTKLQMEGQKMQLQAQHEERMMQLAEQKAAMELQIKQLELQMKEREIGLNMQAKEQEMQLKAEGQRQQFAMDQQARAADMEMQREANDVKRQGMADKAKFDKQRMAQQAKAKSQQQREVRA